MKDLVDRVLKQLPTYLPDLVALVTGPKTSMVAWVRGANGDLSRPLIFVGVSVAIGFLFQLPQIAKEHDFSTLVAGMSMFKLLSLLLFAAIIHSLFRLAGGHATFATTFSTYLFIVSPLYLGLVILETAAIGVLRSWDPATGLMARIDPNQTFADPARWQAFATNAPGLAMAYTLLNLLAFLTVVGWFFICWGALRELHTVTRWRSTLAGVLTVPAGMLFFFAMNFVLLGMFDTKVAPLR